MRQFIIIIVSLAVGAASFWFFSPFFVATDVSDELDPTLQARLAAQQQVDQNRTQSNPAPETEPVETPVSTTPEPEPSVAETYGIQTRGPFPIIGTDDHPASGQVKIIESPEEKLVHYKNYEGTEGADLRVYLSKDLAATDVFELGDTHGSTGDFVYGMPLHVDLSAYRYVLTWSESDGELFDYAKIR